MTEPSNLYPGVHPVRAAALQAHDALQIVWTASVGTPGYRKADWIALAHAIEVLIDLAREPIP